MADDDTNQDEGTGDTDNSGDTADKTLLGGNADNAAKIAAATADKAADTADKGDTSDTDKDGQADKSTGAPETYADFTFPEGIVADTVAMEQFLPVAKEYNLSQEQAQKLIDIQANAVQQHNTEQVAELEKLYTKWKTTARNDEEIGGPDFLAKLGIANKAVEKFGTPELLEAFDATGVGNHPEILRVFYRIGKLLEDDAIRFGKAEQPSTDPAKILFPDMN